MRNTVPPPLNELANRLLARSCLTAIVAFTLFGTTVVSGQTTVEADLAKVGQSANSNHLVHPPAPGVGGTPIRWGSSRPSEDAAARSDECVAWCEQDIRFGGFWWHYAVAEVPWPPWFPFEPGWRYRIGHGMHEFWLEGTCFPSHATCWLLPTDDEILALRVSELTLRISDAVAAQDVEALAGYASLPAVGLFAQRSAIQVLGCDGKTVAAHIPASPELLVAIEVATAQFDS